MRRMQATAIVTMAITVEIDVPDDESPAAVTEQALRDMEYIMEYAGSGCCEIEHEVLEVGNIVAVEIDEPAKEIERQAMMVMSTAHLSTTDQEKLSAGSSLSILADPFAYGVMVHVPDYGDETAGWFKKLEEEDFSSGLISILRQASTEGVGWVRFDRDAEIYPQFPSYEEE